MLEILTNVCGIFIGSVRRDLHREQGVASSNVTDFTTWMFFV